MKNAQLIRALMYAIDIGDIKKASSLMADNFKLSDPDYKNVSKELWLKFQFAIKEAFPDGSFNLQKIEEEGKILTIHYQLTGTHRGDLDLTFMGMPIIPATFKPIKLPPEFAICKIKDGKIATMDIYPDKKNGGGIPGILKQIGATVSK